MDATHLEQLLYSKILAKGLPKPTPEYVFHPSRNWRFDFAWENYMLAVEVEGGIWTGGRHVNPKGFIEDCDKYNSAQLFGWTVLRFTAEHIQSDYAIIQIGLWFSFWRQTDNENRADSITE